MTERPPNRDHDNPIERRTFIAAGSGLGAMLFAGCTSESAPANESDDESTDGETDSAGGNFRLLVSDMPADIGDFDRLDVTLDYARIFDGDDEESNEENGDADEESDDQNGDDDDDTNESSEEETANEDESGGNVERNRGFYTLDLEGATVDLTQVVGDKAIPVFEDELSPGTYEKIELHVEAVEGIVDGEQANVKVPSEKLQITHPFEIGDDSVDFVFDINVVKRGQGNDYNLKPVISESGVAGEDVEVEEVPTDGDDETAEDDTEDDDGESDADDGTGDNEDDTDADDETGDDEDNADPGDGGEGDDPDDGEGA